MKNGDKRCYVSIYLYGDPRRCEKKSGHAGAHRVEVELAYVEWGWLPKSKVARDS